MKKYIRKDKIGDSECRHCGKYEVSNYITSCFECNEGKKDILLEQRMLNKENKNEKNI